MKNIKRIVNTSFWEDEKIVNMFTPEDKYFYLYLLTNPHTTQIGIYKFVPKIAAFETGYSKEAIFVLLERFEKKYDMIRYSENTSEIAIKNFLRHSIVKGGKPVLDCLIKEEKQVKDKSLLEYIYKNLKCKDIDNLTVREYIEHLNNNNIYINDNERFVHESSEQESKPSAKDVQHEADALFETLWKLYPRKLGKALVKPAARRRIYGVGFDRMKRAIEKFNKDMEGRDVQYIMHGSRFFNSGYVDYLDDEDEHVEAQAEEVQVGIDGDILE